MEVKADEGGVTYTRGGYQWFILPAGWFIAFLVVIWILQEFTFLRAWNLLRYTILFMDIFDDLISRRVNSSDVEKFAEICPCPCKSVGWGVIWDFISFVFLLAAVFLGLVSLS